MTSQTSDQKWRLVPLAAIADATLGKTPRRSNYRDSGRYRIVKYRDLKPTGLDFSQTKDGYVADEPAVLRGLRELHPGDVLIGASGHDGSTVGRKVALVDALPNSDRVFFVGELFRIRARSEDADSRWLLHFFSSENGYRALQSAVAGGHLTNGRARQIEVPLAPLDLQAKISDVLDVVRKRSLSAAKHLSAARQAAKRFRRAVLSAACSGRLTQDWRASPGNIAVSAELKARRATRESNRRSTNPPDDRALDEIPAEWAWAALGEVADIRLGGTPSRADERFWGGNIAWVSSGEVANGRIASTRESITELGLASSSAKVYPPGTVLIAMIGEGKTRGQSAILDIEAATNQNVAGILPDRTVLNPEYVWRWALAEYEQTRSAGRGGNQPALNGQKVRDLPIPIPPLTEQAELVRRVDHLLTLSDALVSRVDRVEETVTEIMESLLTRAFRGELLHVRTGHERNGVTTRGHARAR